MVVNGVAVTEYPPIRPVAGRPPVVLVHGGSHGRWCMDFPARAFAEHGFHAYTLDWLNHGDSIDLPQEQFISRSIVDIAHREIRDVVNHLGVDPILVGHSMGGLASLTYATHYPVRKLILMAPVVPSNVGAAPIDIPVDLAVPFPPFPYDVAKQLFYPTMSTDQARQWHSRLVPESPLAVWEATRWTVPLDLEALTTADILVVAAEIEQLAPVSAVSALAPMIGATYEFVAGLGHCDILVDRPLSNTVVNWAALGPS